MTTKRTIAVVVFLGLNSMVYTMMALNYYIANKVGEATADAVVAASEKEERKKNVFSENDLKKGLARGKSRVDDVTKTLEFTSPEKTGKENAIIDRICKGMCTQSSPSDVYVALYATQEGGKKKVHLCVKQHIKDAKTGKVQSKWKEVSAIEWVPMVRVKLANSSTK